MLIVFALTLTDLISLHIEVYIYEIYITYSYYITPIYSTPYQLLFRVWT